MIPIDYLKQAEVRRQLIHRQLISIVGALTEATAAMAEELQSEDLSDSENEATVLGKRERDEQNDTPASDTSMYDDQSDEDIGPMPMPSDVNKTVKKKRKGEYIMSTLT